MQTQQTITLFGTVSNSAISRTSKHYAATVGLVSVLPIEERNKAIEWTAKSSL
jgi:hypothetical protein